LVAARFVGRCFSRLHWSLLRLAFQSSDFQSRADFILAVKDLVQRL